MARLQAVLAAVLCGHRAGHEPTGVMGASFGIAACLLAPMLVGGEAR